MSSKHGVLCQKVVTSANVDMAKIELPALSEEVRQIIRDAGLESLQGLLGPDWQRVIRQLAERYWGAK